MNEAPTIPRATATNHMRLSKDLAPRAAVRQARLAKRGVCYAPNGRAGFSSGNPTDVMSGGYEFVAHTRGRFARYEESLSPKFDSWTSEVSFASTAGYFCCNSTKALSASARDFLEASTAT